MKSVKLIAIIAVVIVVVAGIGVAFMLNDNSPYRSDDDTGRLMIFGNADNNDYLDNEDISTLEKIIAGEMDATPLSDANQDGKVDQSDIDWVRKMVDREPMEIYYQYIYDGNKITKSVKYPVGNIVAVGTNVTVTIKALGGVKNVVAMHGGDMDLTLFSDMVGIPKVSSSILDADLEEVSKYKVDAIVTQDSASYLKNESLFAAAGIGVIRVSASDGLESLTGILTLGYLMDLEERANSYVQFCDEILDRVISSVGSDSMKDSDRVTALSVTMTNYLGGLPSDYYAATQLAGAKNLADWDTTTKRFNIGDEWLLESKYDADFIIHARGIGYGSVDINNVWGTYSIYFTDMRAYSEGNYVILNGNMPVSLRLAYMATIFYPDIFGADWADQLHQRYIDDYMDNLSEKGYDVKVDGVFVIWKSMVES